MQLVGVMVSVERSSLEIWYLYRSPFFLVGAVARVPEVCTIAGTVAVAAARPERCQVPAQAKDKIAARWEG